jgi:hypothetical protein
VFNTSQTSCLDGPARRYRCTTTRPPTTPLLPPPPLPLVTDPSCPRPQDSILKDNTYAGTFGEDGWGAKASAVLMQTKGKGFRHEKTKKKRGTYKGGTIDDTQVNSYKFQYDSD